MLQRSREKIFKFDHIFVEQPTAEVFAVCVVPQIAHALSGFNACVFAYGATGSGKTFTMFGGGKGSRGVIECAVEVRAA